MDGCPCHLQGLEKEIAALHFSSTETDFGEKGVKETKLAVGGLCWFTQDLSFLPCLQPNPCAVMDMFNNILEREAGTRHSP